MALPPSGLRSALDRKADKQAWVDWLFSRIASRYDAGNDLLSLGWHTRWKRRLVELAAPRAGDRVLDLATGTGDVALLTAPLVAPGEVVATDINLDMLEVARRKQPPHVSNVTWAVADALDLPFPDGAFDLVTCGYAGRGFPDLPAVVREVHRVLRPGGRFVNLDFARPPNRWWDRAVRLWLAGFGGVLGTVLHGHPKTYVYIPASMSRYPGQRWLDARMREAGFETRLVETAACLMAYNIGVKVA